MYVFVYSYILTFPWSNRRLRRCLFPNWIEPKKNTNAKRQTSSAGHPTTIPLSLSFSSSLSLFLSLSLSLSLSHSVTPSVSGTMHQFLMCVAPEPQVFFHPRANRITITTFLDISRSGSRRRRQSRLVSSSSFEREFFSFSSSDSSSFFFSFYLLLLWRLFRAQRWVWIWPKSV